MHDLIAMLISTVLGTLVGWERQLGRKPAGLRTHTLVCLGSTMFVLVTKHAVQDIGGPSLDPTRMIHGVITGVGFLGAGSIIRQEGYVAGLTTAASVWMVAAIGVSVGVHAYVLAAIGTGLALVVLEVFRWAEKVLGADADGS
ncbi:MAG: MgtC/SapB family protein [Candidatus Eisenbacteria bacterium]|uniref:MgtC/SapB family protein n=1 Tax=Eiseniibacteriota bacterium TaxID=2212470 RepID=A0A538SRU7_UNCEI|nr:MAG: MgtC/SapB family protein [Candidatus Eisenbacteria bacterium]